MAARLIDHVLVPLEVGVNLAGVLNKKPKDAVDPNSYT
jgi:hypothetical protein